MNPIDFYPFKVKVYKYNRLAIKYDLGLRKCWHRQYGDRLYELPEFYLTMDNRQMNCHNFYVDYCFEVLNFKSHRYNLLQPYSFKR